MGLISHKHSPAAVWKVVRLCCEQLHQKFAAASSCTRSLQT